MAKNSFNFVPMAAKCVCNWGGIEIMLNNAGDSVIYRYFGKLAKRWQEVKYTTTGRAFFTINGRRQYMEDYLRI